MLVLQSRVATLRSSVREIGGYCKGVDKGSLRVCGGGGVSGFQVWDHFFSSTPTVSRTHNSSELNSCASAGAASLDPQP